MDDFCTKMGELHRLFIGCDIDTECPPHLFWIGSHQPIYICPDFVHVRLQGSPKNGCGIVGTATPECCWLPFQCTSDEAGTDQDLTLIFLCIGPDIFDGLFSQHTCIAKCSIRFNQDRKSLVYGMWIKI